MAREIHPTAMVDPKAELGEHVHVGAYSIVGPGVIISGDTRLQHHVSIQGPTTLGPGNQVHPFASIGADPQDKKFYGEVNSRLEIGANNTIREFVTVHRGSEVGSGVTVIGDNNWIMAYCHIAHDCRVGSNTIFANGTTLGGHVTIQDHVTFGGLTAIHQFCVVGQFAFTGGLSKVTKDIPPYVIADGNPLRPRSINKVGLERYGMRATEIGQIERAYRLFYRSHLSTEEALTRIDTELSASPGALAFARFIRESQRGVCR